MAVAGIPLHVVAPVTVERTAPAAVHGRACAVVLTLKDRTAQGAMRHSRIDLTMNVCTDPNLVDVSAAAAALPAFTQVPETEKSQVARNL